jgi:hypothetical protein
LASGQALDGAAPDNAGVKRRVVWSLAGVLAAAMAVACGRHVTLPATASARSPAASQETPTPTPQPAILGPWDNVAASFVDTNTGWVLQTRGATHALRLLHTVDGGATWKPQAVPEPAAVVALQFIDAQHGWIAGMGGGNECWANLHPDCSEVLLRTDDGGATWRKAPLAGGNFTAMRFIGPREGWAMAFNGCGPCNDNPNVLLHTDDGGATWLQGVVDDEPMGGAAGIMLPAGARTAWVFNPLDAKRTTDAGETWTDVANPCPPTTEVGLTFRFVAAGSALDERTAWVVCDELVGTAGPHGVALASLLTVVIVTFGSVRRRREQALLRLRGAQTGLILRLAAGEALIVALLGTGVGIAVGARRRANRVWTLGLRCHGGAGDARPEGRRPPADAGGRQGLRRRFIADLRKRAVTPHVAQHHARPSQRRRPPRDGTPATRRSSASASGWRSSSAGSRPGGRPQAGLHRRSQEQLWAYLTAAAYNLVRIANTARAAA